MKTTIRAAGLALALAATAFPARAAVSDGPTDATCNWEATLRQSYGLTLDPSASTFEASDGVITCSGTFDGRAIAADPGTISFVGGTTDTWCGAGSGWVDARVELRDEAGRKIKRDADVTWNRIGLAMTFTGEVGEAHAVGEGVAEPQNGNCDVDNPLTPEDEGEPVTEVIVRAVMRVTD